MNCEIKKATLKEISSALDSIKTDTLLVVVDSRVWQLYGKALEKNINQILEKDKKVFLYKTLEGEAAKTMQEFEKGLEFFLEKSVHRQCHLVAIGGGATSDFAGFLAASLLRGVTWSVIPTTLLAMVDASIGGKTGLNSKNGKNLVGAFHMPQYVWINEEFLKTLPEGELNSGKGEVIKYGFLSEEIANLLKEKKDLSSIIKACALKKEEIVQRDFTEKGERISLNLGHTFGHAIERIYSIPHGEAVFWGMALIFKLYGTPEQLKMLRRFEAGVKADFGQSPWHNKTFPVEKIIELVSRDKKIKSNGIVRAVTIKEIGQFEIKDLTLEQLKNDFEREKDELRTFDF